MIDTVLFKDYIDGMGVFIQINNVIVKDEAEG